MKVVILDTSILIYKLYHALPRLEYDYGKPVQVVYGLANIILNLVKDLKPDYLFAAYDRPEPTERHKIFAAYKAQRPPMADDLKSQLPLTKKLFAAFNIPILEKPGYEADDIIASVKKIFVNSVEEIIIVSADFDTLQLVDEKTKVFVLKKGISQIDIYDINRVKEKFGILPHQIVDYKTLVGDVSDNIIGVKSIGPKTAASLLNKFGSLENILLAAKEGQIDKKLAEKILERKDDILFYKSLITLNDEIKFSQELLKPFLGFNQAEVFKLFNEFKFKSLLNRLNADIHQGSSDKDSNQSLSLFTNLVNSQKIDRQTPIFIFYDIQDGQIKLINKDNFLIINDQQTLQQIFFLEGEKYAFNLKEIFKTIFKNDLYFDKKITLEKIYDLQIIFWMLYNEVNVSLFKIFKGNPLNQSEFVFQVCSDLKQKLFAEKLADLYFSLDLPLVPILARTELRGLKVDLDELKSMKKFLEAKIQFLREEIFKLSGENFNINSTKQLRVILFEKLKIKTKGLGKTNKGSISTKEEDLIKIIEAHPIIAKIIEYRKLTKLLTTYTDSLLITYDKNSGKIVTAFNQIGSRTGRIISEKPNLQNLPLDHNEIINVRKVFVPHDDFIFISSDYSQLELRLLAHLSEDPGLISAFQQNIDIHSQTAKILFGDDSPLNRRKAKIINFSIIYGSGPKGLAERLNISISQAKEMIDKFFYFYPQVRKYYNNIIEFVKANGYVENLFKRRRLIPELMSNSYKEKSLGERMAINMPIQSLGADLIKKAAVLIDKDIYTNNWQDKAFFIMFIHDEIVFEVHKDIKDIFKDIIKERMENIENLLVPLPVVIKEGFRLSDLK